MSDEESNGIKILGIGEGGKSELYRFSSNNFALWKVN